VSEASYYDQRWAHAEISAAKRERGQLIGEIIEREASRPLRILELGCGTGWLCNELSRFGDVLGVDHSALAIEQASRAFAKPRFAVEDLATWRPSSTYDIVISHEVIEHVRDQRAHVQLAHDALVPGGLFILTTPNAFSSYLAEADVRHGYEMQPIENWLYIDEVRKLLAGFTIEQLTTISPWRSWRNPVLRAVASKGLDKLLARAHAGEVWSRVKGRLGLNASIIAVARR
jgi:2-polyprenyl-3-methyl-5-hydroxy-6-metoxy-1,4-benzoquinol methylase